MSWFQFIWLICVALWIAWVTQAIFAAVLCRKLMRRLSRDRRESHDSWRPRTAVIIPVKGIDDDLQEHMQRLCAQNHPDYLLLFVVESKDDPAYAALTLLQSKHDNVPIHILVAGVAPPNQGQKVFNQLCAIDFLLSQSLDEMIWVFADADAAPGPDWLGDMVGPLRKGKPLITTGYRFFIPMPNEKGQINFWSHMTCLFNASAASWFGKESFNHAWGGSMAIRRDLAIQHELVKYWQGALSDDFQLTRMAHDAGIRIYFVPWCFVKSKITMDYQQAVEFIRRQYIIARIHMPWLMRGARGLQDIYVFGWLTAAIALVVSVSQLLFTTQALCLLVPAALAILFVTVADRLRAHYREQVIRLAFGQETVEQLRETLWYDRWATPLWMALNWVLTHSVMRRKVIRWRGKQYRMNSPQDIEQLN